MTCTKNPKGSTHCYHFTHTPPCFHIGPCEQVCCWCGESPEAEHGPHFPKPWSLGGVTTTSPLPIGGWTCSLCGTYVPFGSFRSCPSWGAQPSPAPWENNSRPKYRCEVYPPSSGAGSTFIDKESAVDFEAHKFWEGDGWSDHLSPRVRS